MHRALVLFAFAGLAVGCGGGFGSAPPAPPLRPPVARPTQKPAPQPAFASACRAVPGTVYGEEAVAFEIDGIRTRAAATVELLDQQGALVARGQLVLPGQWRPPSVPSGDFRLQVADNVVHCTVTVNRELSRASQASR